MQEIINSLKQSTLFLFRINNWSYLRYYNFIEALTYSETISTFWRFSHSPNEKNHSYKKALSFISRHGYNIDDNQEPVFLDENEVRFFSNLPNDLDFLLEGIYFFTLSLENQDEIYEQFLNLIIQDYKDEIRSHYQKNEKSLIDNYRYLTNTGKHDLLCYSQILVNKKIEKDNRKFSRKKD